jgi:hypothetical protein
MDTSATLIRKYLESLEGFSGSRLQDVVDDEVFEVLAGVAWVRQALSDFASGLAPEVRRARFGDLKSLTA